MAHEKDAKGSKAATDQAPPGFVDPFALPDTRPAEKAEKYLIGTLPSCPRYSIAVAGVMFQRTVEPPVGVDKDTGETKRAYSFGEIESLTPNQVERILTSLKRKCIRWDGKKSNGWPLAVDDSRYVREQSDESLAKHLYMVKVSSDMDPAFLARNGKVFPPSIYDVEVAKANRKATAGAA